MWCKWESKWDMSPYNLPIDSASFQAPARFESHRILSVNTLVRKGF